MKILKTFSIYTFIGFLNAGVGFLLLPILTKYLTPEDYGFISLLNTYVSFLIPLISMSVAGYIGVEFFNKSIDKESFKSLFSSVLVLPLGLALPLAIILFSFPDFFARLLELPVTAFYFLLPLTLLVLYQEIFNSFLVITRRTKLFSFSTLSKIVVEIPLAIFLIVYFRMQWEGRILAWAFTAALIFIISLLLFKRWDLITNKLGKRFVFGAIAFGSPLILHQIGKFTIDQSDRLFLAKMISVEEMGIYSVGYQVGMILLILISAFSNFFSPYLLEHLNNITEQKKTEIVKVSFGFMGALFLSLVFLTLFTPLLFDILIDKKFEGGAKYVFWIGLGYFFWGIYMVFSGYIFFLKKNKVLSYLALVNVALNLVGNYYFIQWFGGIGAAYATCLSYAIVSLIIAFTANRLYPMPWLHVLKLGYLKLTR